MCRYENLGDVKDGLYTEGNKILLKMIDGFFNFSSVTSIIEFVCADKQKVSFSYNYFENSLSCVLNL